MKSILILFFGVLFFSCKSADNENYAVIASSQSSSNLDKGEGVAGFVKDSLMISTLRDTLTKEEKELLFQMARENPFLLLSDSVERVYSYPKVDPIVNKLVYSKQELLDSGYVSMSLSFSFDLDYFKIDYQFSLGQASTGFGIAYGYGYGRSNYIHTFRSCGLTNCILTVFNDDVKVVEKEINSN